MAQISDHVEASAGRFWALKLATVIGSSRMERCEDRRDHARHVELQRQMRAFAAIELVADLSLWIGDEQSSLRPLHEDDEADQRHDEDREEESAAD